MFLPQTSSESESREGPYRSRLMGQLAAADRAPPGTRDWKYSRIFGLPVETDLAAHDDCAVWGCFERRKSIAGEIGSSGVAAGRARRSIHPSKKLLIRAFAPSSSSWYHGEYEIKSMEELLVLILPIERF